MKKLLVDKQEGLNKQIKKHMCGDAEASSDPANHPNIYNELPLKIKKELDTWIQENFVKSKTVYRTRTSYGLKHDFQRDTGIYIYNGAFKGAMKKAGFEAADEAQLNWHFKMKERIPDSFWGFCINRYKYNNSCLGDFTRDMEKAPEFPRKSKNKEEVKDYMYRKNACKEAKKAFERAWSYYEKDMNKKI